MLSLLFMFFPLRQGAPDKERESGQRQNSAGWYQNVLHKRCIWESDNVSMGKRLFSSEDKDRPGYSSHVVNHS